MRGAGLAALLGGILQAAVMLWQTRQLILYQALVYHVTWNWNVSKEYRLAAISPWLFFLLALILLHLSVVPWLKRPGWIAISGVIFGILAIMISEAGMILIADPNCYPGILCRQPDFGPFAILSGIGVGGVVLVSGGLLFYGIALMRVKFSRQWAIASLILGLLALHTSIVITEAALRLSGFFKIDPVAIGLGLAWALAWLGVGMTLWLRATTYERQLSAR